MVFARPRFSRIGLLSFPRRFSSSKFCIFLAPTCMTSTSSNRGRWSMLIISVTMGSPIFALAFDKSSSPSAFMPWNAYGEVRGLNAPPRRKAAPDFFTLSATPQICSSLSTEQGPAIRASAPPPIFCPPGRVITVSSGWNLRLAFL